MKKYRLVFWGIVLSLLLFACKSEPIADNAKMTINKQWNCLLDSDTLINLSLPFSVIDELNKAQEIPEPFYDDDISKIQYDISKYRFVKTFQITKKQLAYRFIRLAMGKINGKCQIFLNGKQLPYGFDFLAKEEMDLKDFLQEGNNILELNFKKTAIGDHFKAPFSGGNNWTPLIENYGVLDTWEIKFSNTVNAQKPFLKLLEQKENKLIAQWMIPFESFKNQKLEFVWKFDEKEYRAETFAEKKIGLYALPFQIENPEYWFPWDHNTADTAKLYHGVLEVYANEKLIEIKPLDFGLKYLQWKNNDNQIEFVLNGKSTPVKALWYAPFSWVKPDTEEEFLWQIKEIKKLGFNCLRISSKEDYLREALLAIADKEGVFIWQDIPLGKLPQKWTAAYQVHLRQNYTSLLETYRGHPSVLSLGGISEKDYVLNDSLSGLIHYEIFEQELPRLTNIFSNLEYIPNSSFVWNDAPIQLSHFSFPSFQKLPVWTQESKRDLYGNTWWTRLPPLALTMDSMIQTIIKEHPLPSDLEGLMYYSQIQQGTFLKNQIAQKLKKNPHTLFVPVHLKDTWPAIQSSLMSYFQIPKMSYYMQKRKGVYIEKIGEKEACEYRLKNLGDTDFDDQVIIRFLDQKGHIINEISQNIQLPKKQEELILALTPEALPKKWAAMSNAILEINYGESLAYREVFRFDYRQLPLTDFLYKKEKNGIKIVSNTFMPFTGIKCDQQGQFTQDFYHLLPGDTLYFEFIKENPEDQLQVEGVDILSYYNTFEL